MSALDLKLALAGLLIGGLVGLTGMGGGSLMTPLLIFLGLPPVKAVGTDLAYAAVTKTFGAWRHHVLQNVNYEVAKWLALGSVPASVVGVFTLDRLEGWLGQSPDAFVQDLLGVLLILVGAAFALKAVLRPHPPAEEPLHGLERRQKATAFAVGLVFGFALGLTSVGSGTFFGLALLVFFPLRASRVVGTDVFHAAILVFAAALAHAVSGNVEWGSVSWILVGSVPGILVGARYTGRAPERALRMLLATTLTVSGVALLFS
jgi:uncharacterized membrane protein YfcA